MHNGKWISADINSLDQMGHRKSGHYLFTAYTLLVVNFPGQSANQGYSAIEEREEFSMGHCQNAMT